MNSPYPTPKERELLNHIHSLGVVSDNQLTRGDIATLLNRGWIHQVWIGNYSLTSAGKDARKGI